MTLSLKAIRLDLTSKFDADTLANMRSIVAIDTFDQNFGKFTFWMHFKTDMPPERFHVIVENLSPSEEKHLRHKHLISFIRDKSLHLIIEHPK